MENAAERGVSQTAYQITVATNPACTEGIVWNSGQVASDKSVHIPYGGAALQPATRYYWQVKVWDKRQAQITSTKSAFFETGLMSSGWSNAKWLKHSAASPLAALTQYRIELDFEIADVAAGIIFGAKDAANYFMWQINVEKNQNGKSYLRPHSWAGGSATAHGDIDITSKIRIDKNQTYHLRIDINGDKASTYINDILVDADRTNPRGGNYGFGSLGIGLRADRSEYSGDISEKAYYDNLRVSTETAGQSQTVFAEDFGDPSDFAFTNGEVREGRLFVAGASNYAWMGNGAVPMFRTAFSLDKKVRSARLYASGLGVYDVFINGKRVGNDEFKPGWTDYLKTVFYSTYDVTDLLRGGGNAIGAYVSSGWWKGGVAHGKYGDPALGFIAKLVVNYTDGTSATIVSAPDTWKSSVNGAIRMGDIYNGETFDARKVSVGEWSSPNFDDAAWFACTENTDFSGEIKAFVGPTVQVRPQLQRRPVSITKYEGVTQTGTTYGKINILQTLASPAAIDLGSEQTAVYDMGQNMVGWVKFKVKGAAGTTLTIRFAEWLNDDGSAERGNDGPGGSIYRIALRGAKTTLTYTLRGDPQGEEFHPSTTFFGFRYCDVKATDKVEIQQLVGEVVGTAAEEGASFATSHAAVNQLYSNIQWGQRGNFLSIPTDCPQRDERLGWTGDIQIFGRAATYNADLAGFFHKWMGDMRDGQRADGAFPDVAPHNWVDWGASAWADAGIIIPYTTYLMYADKGILEENYAAMERYMGFLAAQSGGGYAYNGAYDRYGDWVAYTATDRRYISVCYYAYAALLMEKISTALDYADKTAFYAALYRNIKAEFNTRYVKSDGRLQQQANTDTQTAYLLALKLDLFPNEAIRTAGIERLKALIVNNGNKLNTGFVGTGTLNQTLSDVGLTDIAYNLLLQRANPSWLYSVDQGATTIWERWNSYTLESGFNSDISMNSFNHYSYGAVGEWMYRYMAGINADEANAGFKHIILAPQPDLRTALPAGQERITSASASYESYYGTVRSAWQVEQNGVKYNFTVPANTTATLTLPLSSDSDKVFEGNIPAANAQGVMSFAIAGKRAVMELQSGVYSFVVGDGD
jgi:alpha-L-rhamnosidase